MNSDSEPSVTSDLQDNPSTGMFEGIHGKTRFRRFLSEANDEKLSTRIQEMKSDELVNLLGIDDDKQKRTAEILESMSLEFRVKMVRQLVDVERLRSADFSKSNKYGEGFDAIPGVRWEDVGGLWDLKRELEVRIIERIRNPDHFEDLGIEPGAIWLHGPPGCGKTMLVQAMVNRIVSFDYNVSFIHVKGPEILKGGQEKLMTVITDIFTRARECWKLSQSWNTWNILSIGAIESNRKHPPCILFFDNMDAYFTSVPEGTNSLVDQLERELNKNENKKRVHVLGATNRINLVDSRLLTDERFGTNFQISLPGPVERQMILQTLACRKCVDYNISFSDIANKKECENFSGADLNMLMNMAEMAASHDKSSIITVSHFDAAMEAFMFSIDLL